MNVYYFPRLWNDPLMDIAHRLVLELPVLKRYALSLTHNATRAEDLVQDTLLRALDKQHLYQDLPGLTLRSWLLSLMHGQHVNQVRKFVRESGTPVNLDDVQLAAPDDPSVVVEYRETVDALSKLPREQQRVIYAAALNGDHYEELAEFERIPVGTVRSRLSRGRQALRTQDRGTTLSQEELSWL